MDDEYESSYKKWNDSSASSTNPLAPSSPIQSPSYTAPSQYTRPAMGPYDQNYPPPSQFNATNAGGQPYYPQPYFHSDQGFTNYQAPQSQQQQSVVIVGNQPNTAMPIIISHPTVSMTGAIVMSCLVFWFCGWVLGGIAFILAMVGESTASAGDTQGAIHLMRASYGVSIAGIVVGVIIIIVVATVIGLGLSAKHYDKQCYSTDYGYYTCY